LIVRADGGETLTNPEKGTKYPNPNNNALQMAIGRRRGAEDALQLTPAARARAAVPEQDPAEKPKGMARVISLAQASTG
jgi:hypothetical protein